MKSSSNLRASLSAIDHKGYPAYKSLAGSYQFGNFILCIDHVQGDPFASPSSLHIEVLHQHAKFPEEYYVNRNYRIALQDYLTRLFAAKFESYQFKAKGSGKSGLMSITRCGQEVLERSACQIIRFLPLTARSHHSGGKLPVQAVVVDMETIDLQQMVTIPGMSI